jgi:hypothetical protein
MAAITATGFQGMEGNPDMMRSGVGIRNSGRRPVHRNAMVPSMDGALSGKSFQTLSGQYKKKFSFLLVPLPPPDTKACQSIGTDSVLARISIL